VIIGEVEIGDLLIDHILVTRIDSMDMFYNEGEEEGKKKERGGGGGVRGRRKVRRRKEEEEEKRGGREGRGRGKAKECTEEGVVSKKKDTSRLHENGGVWHHRTILKSAITHLYQPVEEEQGKR